MLFLPRLVTVICGLVLCGVLAFWGVRLSRGTPIEVPPPAETAAPSSNGRVEQVLASARLFGSRRPGALSDNVRALGVVADASGRGSVIVSVDGQAPKVYRVGDTLDGRLVAAIRPEEIELEAGGARQVFRLPAARPMATGLTVQGAVVDAGPPPPAMPVQPQLSMPPPLTQSSPSQSMPQAVPQGMPPGMQPQPPPQPRAGSISQ